MTVVDIKALSGKFEERWKELMRNEKPFAFFCLSFFLRSQQKNPDWRYYDLKVATWPMLLYGKCMIYLRLGRRRCAVIYFRKYADN